MQQAAEADKRVDLRRGRSGEPEVAVWGGSKGTVREINAPISGSGNQRDEVTVVALVRPDYTLMQVN